MTKSIQKLFLIAVIILTVGCFNKDNKQETKLPEKQLQLISTITLPIDSNSISNLSNIKFMNSDSGIIFIGQGGGALDFYNLQTKKLIKKIPLEYKGKGLGSMCHFQNWDSIFLFRYYPVGLSLIDSSGKRKENWKINAPLSGGETKYFSRCSDKENVLYNNKHNTISFMPLIGNIEDQLYVRPCRVNYSLNKRKVIKEFGEYPVSYKDTYFNDKMVYDNQQFPYFIDNDSISIFSFPSSHHIHVYNNKTGELMNKYLVKSNYINNIEPVSYESIYDINKLKVYWTKAPKYPKIMFDKYRNCYYRIVKHPSPSKDENGKLINWSLVDWSIIKMDKNFVPQMEYFFKGWKYSRDHVHVVKEGIIIPENNLTDEDEENLKIYIFNVE